MSYCVHIMNTTFKKPNNVFENDIYIRTYDENSKTLKIYENFLGKSILKKKNKKDSWIKKANLIYEGSSINKEIPEGEGILYSSSENKNIVYKGQWVDGLPEGYGIYYYSNGTIQCEGHFKKSFYHGYCNTYKQFTVRNNDQHDTYILYHEKEYEGTFVDGEYHGFGVLFHDNGKRWLEGVWFDGGCHGEFIEYNDNELLTYKGQIEFGEYNGKGTLFYEEGMEKYTGDFKNGIFHGFGILFSRNGIVIYDGEWNNGNQEGFGKIFYDNGLKKYIGDVKNGVCHGNGKLFNLKGTLISEGKFEYGLLKKNLILDSDNIKKLEFTNECSICLEEFAVGNNICTLICRHSFHSECIKTWFTSSEKWSCPLCKS